MIEMISAEVVATSVITGVGGYLLAYLHQKAKNRALLEDYAVLEKEKSKVVRELTIEAENLKKQHTLDIEEIKKEHSLDIDKRKYQYESKRKQYYSLMERLDNFNGCMLNVIQGQLREIMSAYYQSRIFNDRDNTVKFNELALDANNSIREQQAELFSQLNAFKLSTNSEAVKLIEELCLEITKAGVNLTECINYISSESFRDSHGYIPSRFTDYNENNQNKILETKEELISVLKSDLDKM
ncbi:TPA: hypothetical protein ACX3DH_004661 [Vibrio parahaemolyticus]|nr:hypothetical protein [Vibrio parahaemolyticus]